MAEAGLPPVFVGYVVITEVASLTRGLGLLARHLVASNPVVGGDLVDGEVVVSRGTLVQTSTAATAKRWPGPMVSVLTCLKSVKWKKAIKLLRKKGGGNLGDGFELFGS